MVRSSLRVPHGDPDPELIREIYEVESDIVEDSKGNMHILFY